MQKVHTTIDKENEIQEEIVRPYDQKEGETINMKKWNNFMLIIYVVLILMGIGTAYLLSKNMAGSKITLTKPMVIKTSTVEGSTDTTTFKDSAEGVLEKGGSNGEGSHKLIREGGPSQTAYLVSSVVDLDAYVGKKVRMWGQTMAARSVSWLMDVGKIELLSE
jgi:hypothetical protein